MTDIGIHLTQLITESIKVSIYGLNCTMTASRVTLLAEEEEANVDRAEEAGGVTILLRGRFD